MLSRADQQTQLEELDRKCGYESLFYLAKFNLGYSLMQEFPHKEVCRFAEDVALEAGRGLDLEPRGSFKTSIFSQALPIWILLRNPDSRILLDSVVLQNAVDNLGVIKAQFESPRFQFLYGHYVGSKWTTEEITIAKRTQKTIREPSIRCASVEKVQVGPHYDWIIADDLVSKENIETPEQRQKVIDHFKLLFSLLEPEGKIVVIGTRWHFEDLYNVILSQPEFADFKSRIMNAETSGPGGGLYFKERLTKDFLGKQRNRLGRDHYSAQYLNDPAPEDEHSKFQKSWFQRYDTLPINPETGKRIPMYSFLTCDPGGKFKRSDEWVFFNGLTDPSNNLYFHRFVRGNFRMDKAIEILFKLVEETDPIAVGLEVTGQQKYVLEVIQDEMRRRNHFFHIVPLNHAVHSKEYRITRLVPRYECGAIFHSNRMGPLEDQLRRFPKGADDIADAAAMITEIAVNPRSAKSRKGTEIKNVDDLFWKQIAKNRTRRSVSSVLGSEW